MGRLPIIYSSIVFAPVVFYIQKQQNFLDFIYRYAVVMEIIRPNNAWITKLGG